MQDCSHCASRIQVLIAISAILFSGCPSSSSVSSLPAAHDEPVSAESANALEPEAKAAAEANDKTANSTAPAEMSPSADDASREPPSPGPESPASTSVNAPANAGEEVVTAVEDARRLLNQSRRKSSAGDNAGAFIDARNAWNCVQGVSDSLAKELTSQIRAEMDQLAQQLSAESVRSPVNDGRPLILK